MANQEAKTEAFKQEPQTEGRLDTWKHVAEPVWITRYPATEVRQEFFQAYRSAKPVPSGREPWSVGNRRIGTDRGFASLEAAMRGAV